MKPNEIRENLNRPIRFTNPKLYIDGAEYILTGAVFRRDVLRSDWQTVKTACTAAGIAVGVTALSPRAKDLRQSDLKNMAVVIGSEGQGVRKEILEAAGAELIIPMNPHCESLNAAVAATIVMWQMKQ